MISRSALIAACMISTSCVQPVALPSEIHGAWDVSADACTDHESQTGLTITEDRLQFYETTGDIAEVRELDRETVEATVSWTDGNDVNLDDSARMPPPINMAARITPMDGGSRLALRVNEDTRVYLRCADARP